MNNKKLIGIIIAVVLIFSFVVGIVVGVVNHDNKPSDNTNNLEAPVREDGLNLTLTEENLEEIKEVANNAGDMRITKSIVSYEKDPETFVTKDTSLISSQVLFY